LSFTQAEKDGRETRVPPETQGLDVAETSIAKRRTAINTSTENCFGWNGTHSIARCNWNTLQKVSDVHKERKQLCGMKFVQPALQHNDVMVTKHTTETLLDVACLEWGNATITPIIAAKGNLLTHTFEEYSLTACLEVVDIICLKEQAHVQT